MHFHLILTHFSRVPHLTVLFCWCYVPKTSFFFLLEQCFEPLEQHIAARRINTLLRLILLALCTGTLQTNACLARGEGPRVGHLMAQSTATGEAGRLLRGQRCETQARGAQPWNGAEEAGKEYDL